VSTTTTTTTHDDNDATTTPRDDRQQTTQVSTTTTYDNHLDNLDNLTKAHNSRDNTHTTTPPFPASARPGGGRVLGYRGGRA